jgi:hypothetical protein
MGRYTVAGPQRIQLDQPVTRLDVTLIRGRVSVVGAPGAAACDLDATSTSGNVALLASE